MERNNEYTLFIHISFIRTLAVVHINKTLIKINKLYVSHSVQVLRLSVNESLFKDQNFKKET